MDKKRDGWLIAVALLAVIAALMVIFGDKGYPVSGTSVLYGGDTYECMTNLVQGDDGNWYAVVSINGEILGVYFEEEVPLKGVVVKQDGEKVFLPFVDQHGVTVPNPLPTQEE
jgi:hypothetical protein